jgi:glycosyltransferase involved in cell wall biosynthesis
LIESGKNGLLVPVGDVEALAAAMSHLAENPAIAAKMGTEASKIREVYSADTIIAQWLDLIFHL